jgi:hypothetical protein
MYVRGNHNDIRSFYAAMIQCGHIYMGRGAEAEVYWDDEESAHINGWCKWSVYSALISNAISMRDKPDGWYFGNGVNVDELEFVTLFEACKRWNIVMEVYSEESGCQFQEHFICDKGDVTCEECVSWEEYDVYDYETKEEAEEELGIEFTDEEWENRDDRITRGGFENWDFEI